MLHLFGYCSNSNFSHDGLLFHMIISPKIQTFPQQETFSIKSNLFQHKLTVLLRSRVTEILANSKRHHLLLKCWAGMFKKLPSVIKSQFANPYFLQYVNQEIGLHPSFQFQGSRCKYKIPLGNILKPLVSS